MTGPEQAALTMSPEPTPHEHHSAPMTLSGTGLVLIWLLSVALHVLLLVVMFALVFPYGRDQEELDVPVARTEIVGSLEHASFAASRPPDLTEPNQIVEPMDVHFTPKPVTAPLDVMPTPKTDLSIVGVGGGGDFGNLGLSIGQAAGPQFFGLGGSAREARRIIYIVDRSGSMLDTFFFVKQELRRSIGGLRRSQKFHVIFFNEGAPLEPPPRDLVSAIGGRKDAFFTFLDRVSASGSTHPEPAIRRALSLKPDLVYFLSDGADFDPGLLDRLAEWNKDVRAKFFTIAYQDQTGREILEAMARETGGDFKFVSDEELP